MDNDETKPPSDATPLKAAPWQPEIQHRNYFLMGGLAFLGTALILYVLTGYMLFSISQRQPIIEIPGSPSFEAPPGASVQTAPSFEAPPGTLTQRDIYNFFGRILELMLAPILSFSAAIVCTVVGIRLLRSSGAVTTQVISPQDYPILGPAISAGNEQAITQFIRLSSLSGTTGTFTKIGLTGLPLATIFLTILLGLLGLANAQFFDLAKLTLGAFLGSFVQRQTDTSGRPTPRA